MWETRRGAETSPKTAAWKRDREGKTTPNEPEEIDCEDGRWI
jgi:hypothetical protein